MTLNNLATGNIRRQTKNEREAHHGVTSLQGIYPLETSSIRVPCVEDDVWYFEAPVAFLGSLECTTAAAIPAAGPVNQWISARHAMVW